MAGPRSRGYSELQVMITGAGGSYQGIQAQELRGSRGQASSIISLVASVLHRLLSHCCWSEFLVAGKRCPPEEQHRCFNAVFFMAKFRSPSFCHP